MRAARLRWIAALAGLACLVWGGIAGAQDTTLVADRISIEADSTLVAEGAVEITDGGVRLTASRVTYDREADFLTVEGPIVLQDGSATTILASEAEIDGTLQRALMQSARLVLNQQVQIAADELSRVEGQYTRLSRVVASSCNVCGDGPPLWEIRADRVVRDERERQLYFDNAQVRVAGLPVFYLPRLRLPDPTLDRSTGFLAPTIRSRTQLGTGLVTPYFIRLGRHADLTLAPYVSSRTRTLEFGFREKFRRGQIDIEGAVSRDDIRPDDTRAYTFARGRFILPKEFVLSFDFDLVSDRSYLFDYGYSERDRLDSSVGISRFRDDQLVSFEATAFKTLRARELSIEEELPNEVAQFEFRQRLFSDPAMGSLWAGIDGAAIVRPSDEDRIGRDVTRLGARLDWNASRVFQNGMVAEGLATAAVDLYDVAQDSDFDGSVSRSHSGGAVTLRWPMQRRGADGARHLLEPVVQVAWTDANGDMTPNEDSTVVEFDEGNLLALSRFPGVDVREIGGRVNLGATWTRFDPRGWSMSATVGRVYRFDVRDTFGTDTGLSGRVSDWLVAVQYALDTRFKITSRTLLDDNLDLSRSETRFDWTAERGRLSGAHLWRSADRIENRFTDLSELSLDGRYDISDTWAADAEWRYDASDNATTRAGFGLTYENECVAIGLSLSRRFTSSRNVRPATEIDLRLALTGFGNGGSRRSNRAVCRS